MYVKEAFASNYIAPLGPHLDSFEESVSAYLGKNLYCVGLSSGTAALHLALLVAGVKKDDEVWVSSMTFGGGVFQLIILEQNLVSLISIRIHGVLMLIFCLKSLN